MSTKSRYAIVWRVAIIMLIAVFSIAGLTSCGGAATEPTSFSSSGGENNGGETPAPEPTPEPEPEPVYPEDTYYTVHVPNAIEGQGWNGTARVSYKNQEELNRLWKAMMRREGAGDGLINFIALRGHYNYSHDIFNNGQYCWFADNMDIYYKGSLMKKFRGGAIVPLKHNPNKYTVAGVYETATSYYARDIADAALIVFMGVIDGRQAGDLEYVVFNMDVQGRMSGNGVDVYYRSRGFDPNWVRNIDNHLGQPPSWLNGNENGIGRFNMKENYDYTGNFSHGYKYAGGNNWQTITFNAGWDSRGGGSGRGW